jgi:hypothetical protein
MADQQVEKRIIESGEEGLYAALMPDASRIQVLATAWESGDMATVDEMLALFNRPMEDGGYPMGKKEVLLTLLRGNVAPECEQYCRIKLFPILVAVVDTAMSKQGGTVQVPKTIIGEEFQKLVLKLIPEKIVAAVRAGSDYREFLDQLDPELHKLLERFAVYGRLDSESLSGSVIAL